jgi:thiol-disulfide isomerase/thioredoxin
MSKIKKRVEEGKVFKVKSVEEYEKFKNNGLVVIDYFTEWCGPCKTFAPVFTELAKEFPQTKFLSVDAEKIEHKDCESIKSVPTFKIYLNGVLKREFSGIDKDRLIKYIKRYQVQIFHGDGTQREFSEETIDKINQYMKNPYKILLNGKIREDFSEETIEKINDYMKEFPASE